MATFLDVTGLQHFTNIFVFLFVWLVVYAILMWTKLLGTNKFVQVTGGLLLGLFVLMSKGTTRVIAEVAPFVTLIVILVVLLNMLSRTFGGDIQSMPAMKGIILVVVIFIVLGGIALNLRQTYEPSDPSDLSTGPGLFLHPTFLGAVLILVISVFTIAFLTYRAA